MTLVPSFPTTAWSVPPDIAVGLPLMGLSKERPSIGEVEESTPGRMSPSGLRDRATTPCPCSVLVVSHHLDGLLLIDLAGLLHPAPDPGVHRVSVCRETDFLAMPFLPYEAFLPAGSCTASTPPRLPSPSSPRCGVTSPPVLLRVRAFTASLALLTFLPPTPHRRLPVCASSKSRAFRALLRLRVRFPHAVCTARGPVAPLGLG